MLQDGSRRRSTDHEEAKAVYTEAEEAAGVWLPSFIYILLTPNSLCSRQDLLEMRHLASCGLLQDENRNMSRIEIPSTGITACTDRGGMRLVSDHKDKPLGRTENSARWNPKINRYWLKLSPLRNGRLLSLDHSFLTDYRCFKLHECCKVSLIKHSSSPSSWPTFNFLLFVALSALAAAYG